MARFRISPEWLVAAVTSVTLHAVWLVHDAKASYVSVAKPAEVLFEATRELPPKAEPEPSKPADAPQEQPALKNAPLRSASVQKNIPQAAAQAGRTLTAPETPDSSSVADFSMVQGAGDLYVGGTTSSIGTSAAAVHGPASLKAVPAQQAARATTTQLPSGPDRTRGATPNATDWNCSSLFPSDPDAGDYATVVIAVTVQTTGKAKSVAVIRDPGHGFAAAARSCAMLQSYNIALDRLGQPLVATTPPIVVRFTR
jgi:periplasmic protein TonB